MFNILEISIASLATAYLVLLADIIFIYINIGKEQQDVAQLKEMINHTEESIQKVKGLLAAVKNS